MFQLPSDCLDEIFEYLENDRKTLYSCLLVDRLWSEIAVRILWRDSRYYNTFTFRTLIACLPNESKEILRNNEIIISAPTSNPPTFNYASFCKVLLINRVNYLIKKLLENQLSIPSTIRVDIVEHELHKIGRASCRERV